MGPLASESCSETSEYACDERACGIRRADVQSRLHTVGIRVQSLSLGCSCPVQPFVLVVECVHGRVRFVCRVRQRVGGCSRLNV